MRTSHQSTARSTGGRRFGALVVAAALLGAACSSANDSAIGQTTVDAPADQADATQLEAAADQAGVAPIESGGHDFGSTVDEFFGADIEPLPDRPQSTPPPEGFEELTWDDLVPPGFSGAEISARFDERIAAVEPGSPEADAVFAELQAEYDNQPIDAGLSGRDVQLAGFVAPLTYSGDLITEFLLVPYFGACIHVPPPPVNQTVLISLQDGEGLTIEASWGPVWVVGTMTIEGAETDLATAGYSIDGAQTGVYDQF